MVDDAREFTSTLVDEVFLMKTGMIFLKGAAHISDEELQNYESQIQFDDPVNIQYTSGTTGFPKGVTFLIITF